MPAENERDRNERDPDAKGLAQRPLARPRRLEDLLEYQAGSVVSRTLLHKTNGTLTLFAFDQGEGLSEHSTPHDAVVEVLDGSAMITVGDEAHMMREGQALVLPANVPHAVRAETPFKMLLIMIREGSREHAAPATE